MDFGRLTPFLWHKKKSRIRSNVVYHLGSITQVIIGTVTAAKLVNAATGSETSLSISVSTWTVNGNTLTATKIESNAIGTYTGKEFYIKITIGGVDYYSDFITNSSCEHDTTLYTFNDCNNVNFNWDLAALTIPITVYNPQNETPETNTEFEELVTETGTVRIIKRQTTRHRVVFIQPKWFGNFLDGVKSNNTNYYGSDLIENFDWEGEPINELYSKFTISFEYPRLLEGNDCCSDFNLDDFDSPDYGGGGEECEGFSAEIVDTDNVLSVTLTSPPVGVATYRWFRNNVFLSSAPTITALLPGNYRCDVTIAGCRASASYFRDDVCGLFSIRVYSTGNFVNADLSSIPDGCTPDISVVLNGVEVATSLPFEVSETGTYFVRATACQCVRSGGAFVVFSDDSNCNFTASINVNSPDLEAVTNAVSPSYLWQVETASGRTNLGTASTQPIGARGIYWLTITSGLCSKEVYKYLEPSTSTGFCVLTRQTGHEFTVFGIDLLAVIQPITDLEVIVNGVTYTFVSGVPSIANTYGIKSDGKIIFASAIPLSNATIVIRLL